MRYRKKQISESFFLYVLILIILFTFLLSPAKNKNINSKELKNILACRVGLSNSQEIPPKIWTKLQFDIEYYDLNDNFNISNHVFIASVDGLYEINGNVKLQKLGKNKIFQIGIYLNNNLSSLSQGGDMTLLISDCLMLDKNDTIELCVYHDNKKPINTIGSNHSNYINIRKV